MIKTSVNSDIPTVGVVPTSWLSLRAEFVLSAPAALLASESVEGPAVFVSTVCLICRVWVVVSFFSSLSLSSLNDSSSMRPCMERVFDEVPLVDRPATADPPFSSETCREEVEAAGEGRSTCADPLFSSPVGLAESEAPGKLRLVSADPTFSAPAGPGSLGFTLPRRSGLIICIGFTLPLRKPEPLEVGGKMMEPRLDIDASLCVDGVECPDPGDSDPDPDADIVPEALEAAALFLDAALISFRSANFSLRLCKQRHKRKHSEWLVAPPFVFYFFVLFCFCKNTTVRNCGNRT